MERNNYMDFLKGICVFLVIIGHSIVNIPGMNMPLNLIYSFHMPLLMFVSAYIEESSRKKYTGNLGHALKKRAESLLIPYFVWSMIENISFNGGLHINFQELGNRLIGRSATGLWFLIVLFGLKCMHISYWYLQDKFRNNSFFINILWIALLEFILMAFALITKVPYITNMISYSIPYFCGVLYISEAFVQTIFNNKWIVALAGASYLAVFPAFDFNNAAMQTQIIRIFLSLCVIVMCCKYQSKWRENCKWKKEFCLFGRYSLEIYLLHGYFVNYTRLMKNTNQVWLAGVLILVLSAGIAYVNIFLADIINKSKYLRRVLFGKAALHQKA